MKAGRVTQVAIGLPDLEQFNPFLRHDRYQNSPACSFAFSIGGALKTDHPVELATRCRERGVKK